MVTTSCSLKNVQGIKCTKNDFNLMSSNGKVKKNHSLCTLLHSGVPIDINIDIKNREECRNKCRAGGIYYYYKDRPLCLKEIYFYFYEAMLNKDTTILDHVPTATVAMRRSSVFFFCAVLCTKKFQTSPVAEWAVIGGFTRRDFYTQRRVLVPRALPVFIILHNTVSTMCEY